MNYRAWLIELLALWEGRVNTKQLCEQFGISRQQASKDLKAFNLASPTPLIYSSTLKSYSPPEQFEHQHITGLVEEYLHWLATTELPSIQIKKLAQQLKAPQRQISPPIMRALTQAMRETKRLDVDYVSLSAPNREGRVIVPHSFVETGARWHLRAYCEKHAQYRDFVLSRFRGQPQIMDKSSHDKTGDKAWNTQIQLILQPDIRLSAEQQQVIAEDYQMKNGQLSIITRAALASYLLQQMQVNFKTLEADPKAQQLMLVNLDDIKQWLIG